VVKPHLAPMTVDELQRLLSLYPQVGSLQEILTVSERPYSAASLVRTDQQELFVKKRSSRWRTGADLQREHTLITHLTDKGFPTPAVLQTADGQTVVSADEWLYEVHCRAQGEDVYRGNHSWQPFASVAHARSAGATMATFHQAVSDLPIGEPRPIAPMLAQFELARNADLIDAITGLAAQLPALEHFLQGRPWRREIEQAYAPFYGRVHQQLNLLPRCCTHGDWHANNLFFTDNHVSAVIDFHLADFGYRVYDLAVALDRNAVLWLDILAGDTDAVRYDILSAFIAGYLEVGSLTDAERAILPDLLAIHQLDLALTNIAYYEGVEGDRARANWAYETYLLQHTRCYATPWGDQLRKRLQEYLQ
jgi:Ser/Thr protein kinase RdoA (MazF antagonist)